MSVAIQPLARYGCIVILLLLGFSGIAASALASPPLPDPPGRLVSVGSHSLHIYCRGEGRPTVVVDAGLGEVALEWLQVQEQVMAHTRVCLYDRAGLGWSQPGPSPRNSATIVDELHRLLTAAELPDPYLLVGHSFGGYTAQLFAARFPSRIAGLVLVDSSHAEQVERFRAPPLKVNIAPMGMLLHLPPVQVPDPLPDDLRGTVTRLATPLSARLTVKDELQYFRFSAAQVSAAPQVPDVPLVVITRSRQLWPDTEKGRRMEQLWQQLQVELTRLTRQSVQLMAERSGHFIHLQQPELVAQGIRMVLDSARGRGSLPTALAMGAGGIIH